MRSMKESGIDWIGIIPEDWDVVPFRSYVKERAEKNKGEKTRELLALSFALGVTLYKDKVFNMDRVKENYEDYQLVYENDLVLSPNDIIKGSIFVSKYNGCISPMYLVFSVRDAETHYLPYLSYLLRTSAAGRKFFFIARGLIGGILDNGKYVTRRMTVSKQDLLSFQVLLPPLPTQQRIADFLDRKCAEIDELAALQETMIAELKRYKQSVITEAVTKGLDPNVPMKDSGVEWIGEIPEGWEVKKVKNVTTAINKGNGITKEEVFADGDTPCVRYGEIYSKYDNSFVTCISKTKKDVLSTLHYFGNGDILCAGTGELVEEIGKSIVYLGENKCLAGGDIIVLSHNQNPLFLNFALNSRYAQAQKSCSKAKLKVVHISAYDIGSVLIAFPPLSEQRAIADYLDQKCAEIDELIAIKQQKIEALKEYKKSVIFEYVTGKKEL